MYVENNTSLAARLRTWKKRSLQQRGLPGGRGRIPIPPPPPPPPPPPAPLSSSRARSTASSRSTMRTADTKGVGFWRARARLLLTTAHISLPAAEGQGTRLLGCCLRGPGGAVHTEPPATVRVGLSITQQWSWTENDCKWIESNTCWVMSFK